VVKTVEVPGQTVVKEVVKTVEVPGETVVVEKQVVKRVEVPVEKVVVKEVPAAPATAMVAPSGTLTLAIPDIGTTATHPQDCPACWWLGSFSVWDPLLFQTRASDRSVIVESALAGSWTVDPNNKYTEFTLRSGVQFHQGWGELTSADVAFSFDQANHNIYPDSINAIGTEFVNFILEPIEVIDDRTFRILWESHLSFTELKLLTKFFKTMGFNSQKVADENGLEWMRDNFISTGPFELKQWTEHDRAVAEAVVGHWYKTPTMARAVWLEVPENAARRAMLESGQAQIVEVDLKDWSNLLKGGRFKLAEEGTTTNYGIIMGGNYWEQEHPLSGTPLVRELKTELPWVGDIDDPASMEKARKVRQALSMAIDREAINDALFEGLGQPAYQGGIDQNDALFKDEWKVDYDPEAAKQLLSDAGYPDGGFTVDFYGQAQGSQTSEIAKAVASGWLADLNVKTNLIEQPYATYRPNYINRTSHHLSFRAGGGFAPSTWQEEWLISATVAAKDGTMSGGFNSGIEIPEASEAQRLKTEAMTDADTIAAVNLLYDALSHQAVWPGTVQVVNRAVYDSQAILDWPMRPTAGSIVREIEEIRMR
jgi:ABC-type transport system substrate-binding protein